MATAIRGEQWCRCADSPEPDWPPGGNAATPSLAAATAALELPPTFPVGDGVRTDLALSDAEVAAKRAALNKYQSQQEVMASLLAAFVRRTEPFVLLSPAVLEKTGLIVTQSVASEQELEAIRAAHTGPAKHRTGHDAITGTEHDNGPPKW